VPGWIVVDSHDGEVVKAWIDQVVAAQGDIEAASLTIHADRGSLLGLQGVGLDTAGQLLVTAGDNPDRIHGEAAFAHLCGAAPIPASSGKTTGRTDSTGAANVPPTTPSTGS
jgi:hypothetical protein